MAKLPEPEELWHPRLSEVRLTERILMNMSDQLQHLSIVMSGTKQQVKPFPRPKTKIDEVRERLDYEWAKGFIQRLGFDENDI